MHPAHGPLSELLPNQLHASPLGLTQWQPTLLSPTVGHF